MCPRMASQWLSNDFKSLEFSFPFERENSKVTERFDFCITNLRERLLVARTGPSTPRFYVQFLLIM